MNTIIEKYTFAFLQNLKSHNSKDWFHSHRKDYESARDNVFNFTMFLIGEIGKFDETVLGVDPDDCIFRIFRDTRFSRDKHPYKTNFGSFIKSGGRKTPGAGYYLHISPDENFISGGIYMPPPPLLNSIRADIAKNPSEFKKIINGPVFIKEYGALTGEQLKTAPKGFPRDHPEIELLKFKHYIAIKYLTRGEVLDKGFAKKSIKGFAALEAFNRYLNKAMGI